ncbi:MAG: 5-enolpyruvylshikimate-3-phosphate synthase [Candidatus Methanohalarchaeum thermophilum]|uniref:3-phosphoshikimate 1-carboxyvinyltransferase n=1 Tax=Methanohalarchaeum thermophilum TaxID=1903181 RepID=A0A1Q6DVX1_METT1|nr:MAG: 5-enolpyruvylshikimate-3-phosphate synthase [Candidatus Methanohalarchaeum thermophilum]
MDWVVFVGVEIKGTKDVGGVVDAPPSKSYSHRAVFVAAMSGGRSKIFNPLISRDIEATINGLRELGAKIDRFERGYLAVEGFGNKPKPPSDVVDLMNSGTSMRFLMGVGCHLGEGALILTGDQSLRERPNQPLIDSLNELGGRVFSSRSNGKLPIVVKGKLKGGPTSITGQVSSQFISSLLLCSPIAEEGVSINLLDGMKSSPYIDMTREVMEEAGISFKDDLEIRGNQSYTPINYSVPGDFSSAANLLALGALSDGKVVVKNLKETQQGDKVILDVLEEFGADVSWEGSNVVVHGDNLEGITYDASNTPDLVPVISILGAFASGETRITNVEHARYKETDRISAMSTELQKMGAEVIEKRDGLIIRDSKLRGTKLSGHEDHRIVMALTLAAAFASGKSIITDEEYVKISFPGFFEKISQLGVECVRSKK